MKTIDADQLRQFIAADRRGPVVNVLDKSDYEAKHIPGSINIPYDSDNFTDRISSHVQTKDTPVVVYCASRECDASERAARQLENAGFTNVQDYAPGVKGWENKGYQLEGTATPR